MHIRPLGRTGLEVSVLGFGAFKIGRNQGIKCARGCVCLDLSKINL